MSFSCDLSTTSNFSFFSIYSYNSFNLNGLFEFKFCLINSRVFRIKRNFLALDLFIVVAFKFSGNYRFLSLLIAQLNTEIRKWAQTPLQTVGLPGLLVTRKFF